MLVERLWLPTQKDLLAGLRQQRFLFNGSTAAAAATITFTAISSSPSDTARFITGVGAQCTPGAAQTWDYAQVSVVPAGGSISAASNIVPIENPTRVAALTTGKHVLCDFMLLPTDQLIFQFFFNAGAASNTVNAFVHGYDIPRANLV